MSVTGKINFAIERLRQLRNELAEIKHTATEHTAPELKLKERLGVLYYDIRKVEVTLALALKQMPSDDQAASATEPPDEGGGPRLV